MNENLHFVHSLLSFFAHSNNYEQKWGCKGHVEKLSIKLRKKQYIEKVTVINFISQNAMHKS